MYPPIGVPLRTRAAAEFGPATSCEGFTRNHQDHPGRHRQHHRHHRRRVTLGQGQRYARLHKSDPPSSRVLEKGRKIRPHSPSGIFFDRGSFLLAQLLSQSSPSGLHRSAWPLSPSPSAPAGEAHIPMHILVAAPYLSLDQAGDASMLSFLGHDWLLTGISDLSFLCAQKHTPASLSGGSFTRYPGAQVYSSAGRIFPSTIESTKGSGWYKLAIPANRTICPTGTLRARSAKVNSTS